MPNPGTPDLHVNAPLTNVSVAYFQDQSNYVADQVFPSIPVDKRSDIYWKYSKSDFRRTDAARRAPGTKSPRITWNPTTDQYYCHVYSVSDAIDDQTRSNADSNWDLDADATRLLTQHLLIQKDQLWASTFFRTGIWSRDMTGVGASPSGSNQFLQWNLASSDPLVDTTAIHNDFKLSTGNDINFMVLGADVWKALRNHPAVLDRIKWTQKGVVTRDLIASFFDVPKLLVAYSSQATVPQINDAAAQDAAATYNWIIDSKSILMGYAPSSPSLKTPSAGYTFNWKGYSKGNKHGLAISQYREQAIRSDVIEAEAAYDMKLVSPDCGVFLSGAVA